MDEIDRLVDQGAIVPVRAKKMPKIPTFQKTTSTSLNEVRTAALELIQGADNASKQAIVKHKQVLQKVQKVQMPEKAVYEAFKHFEEALGGRPALIKALQHCPENSQGFALIMKLLGDSDFLDFNINKNNKQNVKYGLAVICSKHKIPLNALVTAFRDATMSKVAFESLNQVAAEAPRVVEQLVQDSQNRYEPCEVCEGTGRIWRIGENGEWLLDPKTGDHVTILCHICRGQGKKFVKHDVQNRKMFLEMAGLTQGKQPLVQQTFNQQAFVPGDGSFEKMLRGIDTAIVVKNETVKVDIPNTVYEAEVVSEEGTIPSSSS